MSTLLSLFDVYFRNLELIKQYISIIPDISNLDKIYMCPICLAIFQKVPSNSPVPVLNMELSIEHIIARKLGGTNNLVVLTCKICNNKMGELEGHFIQRRRYGNALLFKPNSKTKVNYEITVDGKQIVLPADLIIAPNEDEPNQIIGRRANPIDVKKAQDSFESESVREIIIRIRSSNSNLGNLNVVFLKIAYLYLFRVLGYSVILHPHMQQVRDQIKNPKAKILPFAWTFDGAEIPDERLGITLITSPHKCFLIAFDTLVDGHTRRHGVILPAVVEPGIQIYQLLQGNPTRLNGPLVKENEFFLHDKDGVIFAYMSWPNS